MKLETNSIKPRNESVLVSVLFKEDIDADGNYVGGDVQANKMNIEFYHGTVEGFGEKADNDNQCPGLNNGDHIIFSQFAGCSVPTEDKFCKIIRGYDIIAIAKDVNMEKDSIKPTADRILIDVIEESSIDDGGFYNGGEHNPAEKQTQKGVILELGPNVDSSQFQKGDTVFFDPYCGNMIIDNTKMKLKTINSFDVLFTI